MPQPAVAHVPPPSPIAPAMPSPVTPLDRYLLFLRSLLSTMENARGFALNPNALDESSFIVDDDRGGFWELICVRVKGSEQLVLGAAKFQRQSQDWTTYGRRSLAHYMASPPRQIEVHRAVYPAGLLELRTPSPTQTIGGFMRGLGAGGEAGVLLVDTERIRFAFDFRRDNPSLDKGGHPLRVTSQQLLLRTVDGRILSGYSHGLSNKLNREDAFLGLTKVRQHTATRTIPMPTLIVRRDYLSMIAVPGEGERLEDWLGSAGPFHAETASRHHALDARL